MASALMKDGKLLDDKRYRASINGYSRSLRDFLRNSLTAMTVVPKTQNLP
jgi:hypothetical protein